MQRYIRTNIAYIHRPDLDKSTSCIKYGYLFRDKSINKDGFIGVHHEDWCSPFHFYFESNGLETKQVNQIIPGDKIITCDPASYHEISQIYSSNIVFDNNDCFGFEIIN